MLLPSRTETISPLKSAAPYLGRNRITAAMRKTENINFSIRISLIVLAQEADLE